VLHHGQDGHVEVQWCPPKGTYKESSWRNISIQQKFEAKKIRLQNEDESWPTSASYKIMSISKKDLLVCGLGINKNGSIRKTKTRETAERQIREFYSSSSSNQGAAR